MTKTKIIILILLSLLVIAPKAIANPIQSKDKNSVAKTKDVKKNVPSFCTTPSLQKKIKNIYWRSEYPRQSLRRKGVDILHSCLPSPHYSKYRKKYRQIKKTSWNRWHKWDVRYKKLSPTIKNHLRRIRGCETRGMSQPYRANTGNGFYGAYQWMYGSWRSLVGGKKRPDLATPREQDVRTAMLLKRGGSHHWPNCG